MVEAPYGVLRWRGAADPAFAAVIRRGDELESQAVRVGDAEHRLAEAVFGLLEAYPRFHEPFGPVA